jgi:hypothetical protein
VTGAVLAALAVLVGADPTAPQKLVLEPLEVRDAPRPLATLLEQRVCQALAEQVPGAELVCPDDVAAASTMARNDAIMGTCRSDACMERVEEMKKAPRKVTGSLAREGKALLLTLVLRVDGVAAPRVVKAKLPDDLEPALARVPALVKELL